MAGNRTPDLSTLLRNSLKQFGDGLHVMMPAIVESYDAATQLAKVQPLLQETPRNELPRNLPPLLEVPVRWPRVGLAVMYMPMKLGDKVGLVFADKSLDNWQGSDGTTPLDPQDTRAHDLTDAWAIPGMYPPTDPIPNVDPADIRIILFDTSGAVRSQFYLGGDTGDIVALAENLIMLGDAAASEQAVLGNALLTLFNANVIAYSVHTHNGAVGVPALAPELMTSMSMTELATKVNVK